MLLEELAQLPFRQRAREAVHQLPVLDQDHGRDRADLEGRGELLLLVDIDLGQSERAVVFRGQFFQDRAELLAGPAPLGPEIDQDRGFQRFLQDIGLEAVGGGVEDVEGVGHGGSVGEGLAADMVAARGRCKSTQTITDVGPHGCVANV